MLKSLKKCCPRNFLGLTVGICEILLLNLPANIRKTHQSLKYFLNILKVLAPFALSAAILWWMYRGIDLKTLVYAICHEMNWGWMAVSLLLGAVPQVIRAERWRMALRPLGENVSRRLCADAIFLSYAASLVVPRIGEVTRCGTLKTYGGVSFTRGLGTVVTERIVDSVLMLLISLVAFVSQLPQFLDFLKSTGFDFAEVFGRFTQTGYIVTALCLIVSAVFLLTLVWRLTVFKRGREWVSSFAEGILSLRKVEHLWLYLLYSIGIWIGYYLHFYLAFFCFDFTSAINPMAAFLIFCVGTFAVLVPTPNGAGPWHFAVKTMLLLYGVAEQPAILFALVVHTVQTALVVVLGAWGWLDLNFRRRA